MVAVRATINPLQLPEVAAFLWSLTQKDLGLNRNIDGLLRTAAIIK